MNIQTFEPNEEGRDFVIGDLHGSYSCFENLLKHLNFDKTNDRMFSVGDLVDRGPNSIDCLSLLDESWFHATLSNHEQMMLEAFRGGHMGEYWIPNGGEWGVDTLQVAVNQYHSNELHRSNPTANDLRLLKLLPKVQALPFLITVNMKDGRKFHVIHAELPPGNTITDAELSSPSAVEKLAKTFSGDGDYFLWGRFLFRQFYNTNLENTDKVIRTVANKFNKGFYLFNDALSHIISGHTVVQRPITIVGQTNIDTGAYSSYKWGAPAWPALTCVQLDTWEFFQATETMFRRVEPLVVNKADLQAIYDVRDTPRNGSNESS